MRSAKWTVLLMITMALCPAMSQPLPRSVKIVISGRFMGEVVGGDLQSCKQATTTPAAIHKRFSSFHRISQEELHDLYDFVDCGVQGTISLGGRRYEWRLYITDVLETTYPDETPHWMAGKPDLSDRASSSEVSQHR